MIRHSFHICWLCFGLMTGFFIQAHAQSIQKLTKNISKAYQVSENTTVDISNKYGQVLISTWDKDSVVINIEIVAYERTNEAVGKLMDRVEIELDYFGGFVTSKTILDRNTSFIKERWNSLGDYSKTLLSKNKISIDYEIFMPHAATLILENKFGDVVIDGKLGSTKITMAHGDLKAQSFEGLTRLDISFGKAKIKTIKQGYMVLKSATLEIQKVGDLNIESTSSQININEIEGINLLSRNDQIIINKARVLSGNSNFSDIKMEKLLDIIDYKLKYGGIVITHVNANFSKVDVQSESADINLTFENGSYAEVSLIGNEDKMFLSKNLVSMQRAVMDEKSGLISLDGTIGLKKPKKSKVSVISNGAEMLIYMNETGYSNK